MAEIRFRCIDGRDIVPLPEDVRARVALAGATRAEVAPLARALARAADKGGVGVEVRVWRQDGGWGQDVYDVAEDPAPHRGGWSTRQGRAQ